MLPENEFKLHWQHSDKSKMEEAKTKTNKKKKEEEEEDKVEEG